ncbi:MAG: hypothetical protein IKA73_01640 [Alphaproteobacteria bacterium]|nr:hypothetical protein [Alphaproteobacteria bacterium]MBR2482383.1 hypothetical protein [Alphaproteobacteria bacterium]
MKTKIIYISGTEVFDMREIRAAFDEVRSALGLAKDTILFGVPVDADDALANTTEIAQNTGVSAVSTTIEPDVTVAEAEEKPVENITEEIIPTTVKKTRKRTVKEITEPVVEVAAEPAIAETIIESEPIIESVAVAATAEEPTEEEPIIPILSILASSVDDDEQPQDSVQEQEVVAEPETPVVEVEEAPVVETEEIVADVIEETTEPIDDADAVQVSVGDIISNEAPVAEKEKTLEELLESMTPLREDVETPVADDTVEPEQDFDVVPDMDPDTDATLAQLANEFAAAQDKIVSIEKPESQGKIGKLKNILPFKKAKRDDSSLMGDLFGWAGIAANDEDFSIPGFFTTAASKK